MNAFPQHRIQELKDKAVMTGWIALLLLLISILWILTNEAHVNYLLRTVNNIFASNNDSRRLSAHLQKKPSRADPLGFWYSIHNSNDKMFVFTVFKDGILVPLGAVVSDDDVVKEVIPLSAHAVQTFNDISESILKMYIIRIEKSAARQTKGDI